MLHDEERGFFAAIQLHQAESPRTPTQPGGVTARSDSTKRTRRAATPRPSRCSPSGIAKRVDAGSSSPTLELEFLALSPFTSTWRNHRALRLHQAESPRGNTAPLEVQPVGYR